MTLERSRDLELRGRARHTIYRRIALAVLALIVLAALLDVFGQETSTTVATGRAASLSVDAPRQLRGGLIFQARFQIGARRRLGHPKLVLSSGWLDGMTLNTIAPEPESASSSADTLALSFAPLPAGQTMTVWTNWQVNPTDVGHHDEDVTLFDGTIPVATVHRNANVFP